MFVEYQNSREAVEAVKGLNGYVLDKQHKLIVNHFQDFAKLVLNAVQYECQP
jgi:hypothetical protein